jgi:hypothetical protein
MGNFFLFAKLNVFIGHLNEKFKIWARAKGVIIFYGIPTSPSLAFVELLFKFLKRGIEKIGDLSVKAVSEWLHDR